MKLKMKRSRVRRKEADQKLAIEVIELKQKTKN
jgi:hypothetical protein